MTNEASKEYEPMDLVFYPDPFLTKPCRTIKPDEIKAGVASGVNLRELIERMRVTMYKNAGIGLAAPQVRVGLRVFVADISKDKTGFFAILNPELSDMAGWVTEEEGCLSIPGIRAKVKRRAELKIKGVDLDGKPLEFDAKELLARVCQHENDHLLGELFINKIGTAARFMARRALEDLEYDYEVAQRKKAKAAKG